MWEWGPIYTCTSPRSRSRDLAPIPSQPSCPLLRLCDGMPGLGPSLDEEEIILGNPCILSQNHLCHSTMGFCFSSLVAEASEQGRLTVYLGSISYLHLEPMASTLPEETLPFVSKMSILNRKSRILQRNNQKWLVQGGGDGVTDALICGQAGVCISRMIIYYSQNRVLHNCIQQRKLQSGVVAITAESSCMQINSGLMSVGLSQPWIVSFLLGRAQGCQNGSRFQQ